MNPYETVMQEINMGPVQCGVWGGGGRDLACVMEIGVVSRCGKYCYVHMR